MRRVEGFALVCASFVSAIRWRMYMRMCECVLCDWKEGGEASMERAHEERSARAKGVKVRVLLQRMRKNQHAKVVKEER